MGARSRFEASTPSPPGTGSGRAMPLGLLAEGESGEIVPGRRDGAVDARVEELGLRAGNRVTVLRNAAGPLLVKVDESRIALDRAIAMRIGVRREAG